MQRKRAIQKAAIMRAFLLFSRFIIIFLPVVPLRAQEPTLASDNLKFTKSVIEKSQLTANVSLRTGQSEYLRYRFDRSPDLERITLPDFIAVKPKGKGWVKSDDWGKIGDPVDSKMLTHLTSLASIVDSPFQTPVSHDQQQGDFVWKFIERTKKQDCELFTLELTREHPHSDGYYPRFTFIKHAVDRDGNLLLGYYDAQMRIGDQMVPATIDFHYQQVTAIDNSLSEVWITGEPFLADGAILFRAEKPVSGNSKGNVVLVGVEKPYANATALLMRAAERHVKMRLYGRLVPYSGSLPIPRDKLPSMQFIVWKFHAPSDPDELPQNTKITMHPEDTIPGYEVKVKHE